MGYKIGVAVGAILIAVLVFLHLAAFFGLRVLKDSPAGQVDMGEMYQNYLGDLKD